MRASMDSGDASYGYGEPKISGEIDLFKLNKELDKIDYASIRRRRHLYSRLYHEATISHRTGKGISFTDMLLLLAHHKLIVDKDALMCVLLW